MASTSGNTVPADSGTPPLKSQLPAMGTLAHNSQVPEIDSSQFHIDPYVRRLLNTEVIRYEPGSINRWLHDGLSRLNAIRPADAEFPLPENGVLALAKVEAELGPCLHSIVELMEKDTSKERMDTLNAELTSYATADEAERNKHFVKAANTAFELLQSHTIHESSIPPAFDDPNSVAFMRHDSAPIESIQDSHGKARYQRPDVILAYRQHIEALYPEPLTTEELLKAVMDEPPSSLEWSEGLLFVEKKLGSNRRIIRPPYTADILVEIEIPDQSALWEEIQEVSQETNDLGDARLIALSMASSSQPRTSNGQDDLQEGENKKRSASDAGLDSCGAERKKAKSKFMKKLDRVLEANNWRYRDPTKQHAAVQLANYAAETMTRTFGRNHALGLMLTGSMLNIWRFDREGDPIQMTGFDVFEDFPTFLLFLFVIQRFTPADWGYLPRFDDLNRRAISKVEAEKLATEAAAKAINKTGQQVPDAADVAERTRKIMEEDSIRTLDLTDIMVSPYKPSSGTATFKGTKGDEIPTRFGLSGRATGVKGGELVVSPDGDGGKEESNREVVLKLSWGEVGRNREKVIIDKAREAFQGKEFAEGGDPCDYLPEILGEKVFEDFDTDIVRKAILEDYEAYRAKRPFARRYPVLVMLPKYEPIRVITSMHAATQVSLFIALIYCHAMLWSVGVEHGDISESNLMYEESTGRPKLCDYDLSHIRGDYRPSEHLNPGTWAFMAGDLLTAEAMEGKVTRLYRHDFESFLAVLVWISLRYNNGERVPCPRLDGWAQGDFRRCYAYREDTYTSISFGHFDCPDWLSSDMWYGIEMLVHDFKRILTTRDIAKGKVREKERMKSKSEESLAGKAQTPEAPKKVDFLPDRGLLSNEGFFFRPRGGASVAVPVETPVWKEEDEESLAALKKDVESYDDVRFVNKAASMMELFKFNRSIGPYFTTLLQDNLKVADVSA